MLGRTERRRLRHERNIEKERIHKEEAKEKGKIIEENHNDGPFSVEYTMELTSTLVRRLLEERTEGNLLRAVQQFKGRMISLILHYNPSVPKGPDYEYIKKLLEVYWDEVLGLGNEGALEGI